MQDASLLWEAGVRVMGMLGLYRTDQRRGIAHSWLFSVIQLDCAGRVYHGRSRSDGGTGVLETAPARKSAWRPGVLRQ
jgi:hypothetical protein